MTQKLKSLVLAITMLFVGLAPVAAAVPVYAEDITSNLCQGVDLQIQPNTGGGDCSNSSGFSNLQTLLGNVVNYVSIFVGVIAVFLIIIGGLRYITSGGDSGKVSGAKTTIIYALIGLVVVALAQLIVRFVLGQALGIVSGS